MKPKKLGGGWHEMIGWTDLPPCQFLLIILSRALPMVSSLIGPQYHDDEFWTFSESAAEHQTNNFDVKMVPTFSEDFEV